MFGSVLRRHLRRFKKHGAFMFVAVCGQLACRSIVAESTLRGASDLAGNFLQTFGGMYGVIIAFIIYVVWQQHNETQVTVEREAVALGELFRLLSWFPSWPERDQVRESLVRYARSVPLRNEPRFSGTVPEEGSVLERSYATFLDYAPAEGHEQRLYDTALARFHELNEVRERRLTVAALRLPEALRWFVYIGGAITVCTLWLAWIESEALHALFTAAMTWVIVAAASIVADLDSPFSGDFIVDWYRFHEAAEHMEGLACPAPRHSAR